ncbi:MAG: hypothetical protein NC311_07520 [Muribaculaceae bacterium]|nr:hypothetical protein [Muribaculaceae bacterium]
MSNQEIYRDVKAIDGLSCTCDGKFRYRGRMKSVIYAKKNFGNGKATARLTFFNKNGKTRYIQAAKAVAMAWKPNYEDGDYIIFKDEDIHNICADNLILCDKADYYEYLRRNSKHIADGIEERKRKLQLVADEALLTKHYFETLDIQPINQHVKEYLYACLMKYCKETLFLGERIALDIVPECLARMYECIMNGMCLYNYERYCKKMLLNYKKKGNFGLTGEIPKPIEINVQSLNLDCLWERFQKSTRK